MAIINNTPMVIGGGGSSPGKKYTLKNVTIPTTITNNSGTINVEVQQNEYMTTFWQWLWENSSPGMWELIVTPNFGTLSQYGLTPSYPYKTVFTLGMPATINFATNESYDPKNDAYESVVLNNAQVIAGTNRLTFSLSNLSFRKIMPTKEGYMTSKRQTLISDISKLTIEVRIMVLEESEA